MARGGNWYELFSRGARDWLRHNSKIREAVQGHLPDLVAGPDLISGSQQRSVQVPVKLLEHAHFRLASARTSLGAGQGQGQPGDVLRPAPGDRHGGGDHDGGVRLLLELSMDEILDWLWEELQLPELRPNNHTVLERAELRREGWDRHGAPARLDRRRTVKEAIKRRAIQAGSAPFTNDDLRFRQVRVRQRPASSAVVFFVLDVSASMTEAERRLAKTFFFFALQGIRRSYQQVQTRFIAHTTRAWEFSEADFFQVSGAGGTIASTAFKLVLSEVQAQYTEGGHNVYLFYASDGENFVEDRGPASSALGQLAQQLNYVGYAETLPGNTLAMDTEMRRLFAELERQRRPVACCVLNESADIWLGIRKFFAHQAQPAS